MDAFFGSCSIFYLSLLGMVMTITPANKQIFMMDPTGDDIVDFITSKGYLPNEKALPKPHLIKNIDNDATYILSKLSDEELLKLLDEQPHKEAYNLKDIVQIAFGGAPEPTQKQGHLNHLEDTFVDKTRFHKIPSKDEVPSAFYRLENKPVDPSPGKIDINYIALQKLKNLLNSYSLTNTEEGENDEQKELIFDILVAQLKALCCKKTKKLDANKYNYRTILNELFPSNLKKKLQSGNRLVSSKDVNNEFMFLIINDDIKSNGSEEIMVVDPESLDGKSSVLLLGPVKTPLADDQLKLVMTRISDELAKPEYLSLLQQLSDGVLIDNNKSIMKNFVLGPETRRYIKPHRCNHQSKLARIYGGPKWIICTGYLNINKPSLYD